MTRAGGRARTGAGPAWFVRGDVDGFFALALDNLIQLLVIVALCGGLLGFGPELLFAHVLPGAAVSVLVGNVFYAWQARRLAEREGRTDVTALPYGINTVSLFAYVFLVMLPAKLAAEAAGATVEAAAVVAWQAGLAACFGSALVECIGAAGADWLRRRTPRAALLSTLAGIAVSFIALGFLYRAFGSPIVGVVTFGAVLLGYFGGGRFRGGIPAGLVAVTLGIALSWATGLATTDAAAWSAASAQVGLRLPVPVLGDLWAGISGGGFATYFSVIVPMGIVNVVGSLQNIESAEAAGDRFDTAPALLINGAGSLAAALFGSCFPTTIYIGHPGWKRMGARLGYSVLGGAFISVVCVTGAVALLALAVPIEAGMAIVLWIGVIMAAQAFDATPARHAPAVAVGLLPGIAAWGTLMLKNGLRAGGVGGPGGQPFSADLEVALAAADVSARGAFSIEQGFIFTAMIWAAATAEIIDRRPRAAAVWMAAASVLAYFGMIHAYAYTPGDAVGHLAAGAGASWALAYVLLAALLYAAPWLIEDDGGSAH